MWWERDLHCALWNRRRAQMYILRVLVMIPITPNTLTSRVSCNMKGPGHFLCFEKESCIVHNIYTKQEEGFFLICPSRTNHYQQQWLWHKSTSQFHKWHLSRSPSSRGAPGIQLLENDNLCCNGCVCLYCPLWLPMFSNANAIGYSSTLMGRN